MACKRLNGWARTRCVADLVKRDGLRCVWCSCALGKETGVERPTVDHLLPRSCGGNSKLYNVALACQRCNADRKNTHVRKYARICLARGQKVRLDVLAAAFRQMEQAFSCDAQAQTTGVLTHISRQRQALASLNTMKVAV
jgi:5-methylcytosine-specific restriction endonuclease McrA